MLLMQPRRLLQQLPHKTRADGRGHRMLLLQPRRLLQQQPHRTLRVGVAELLGDCRHKRLL